MRTQYPQNTAPARQTSAGIAAQDSLFQTAVEALKNDADLVSLAKSGNREEFQAAFIGKFRGEVTKVHDRVDKLTRKFFNNPDFREEATSYLTTRIYDRVRKESQKELYTAGYDLGVKACESGKSGVPCEDGDLRKFWQTIPSHWQTVEMGGVRTSINGWRAGYDTVRNARRAKASKEFWAKVATERGAE